MKNYCDMLLPNSLNTLPITRVHVTEQLRSKTMMVSPFIRLLLLPLLAVVSESLCLNRNGMERHVIWDKVSHSHVWLLPVPYPPLHSIHFILRSSSSSCFMSDNPNFPFYPCPSHIRRVKPTPVDDVLYHIVNHPHFLSFIGSSRRRSESFRSNLLLLMPPNAQRGRTVRSFFLSVCLPQDDSFIDRSFSAASIKSTLLACMPLCATILKASPRIEG